MKLLLIEDEEQLAQSILQFLASEEYVCEHAPTFEKASEKIEMYDYECVLLDIGLPDGDGLKILHKLRNLQRNAGVIIISAKNSLDDKVEGLQTGADDYLTKPFHLPELSARIYAVTRRKQFENRNILRQNALSIDLLAKEASANGMPLPLTKTEFALLLYFISNKNRVLSKSSLAEHIAGDLADMLDSHDFVYAHVKNLKKKLAEAGCTSCLRTVYGAGYRWEAAS